MWLLFTFITFVAHHAKLNERFVRAMYCNVISCSFYFTHVALITHHAKQNGHLVRAM